MPNVGRTFALCAGFLFAASAHAAPNAKTATLTYLRKEGAEACPDQRSIEQAVSARLGYTAFVENGERRIDVQVARFGRGLIATVTLGDSEGNRTGRRDLRSETGDCG